MTSEYNPDRVVNLAFLMGGIVAFVFGLILLIRQDAAIGVVMLLIGLWWLIQGTFLIFSVFIDRQDMWWKLLLGVIGVSAGIVVLANPVQTGEVLGTALTWVLGFIGLAAAIVAIIGGFRGGGFAAILFGVISGAIALLIMLFPAGSFTTLVTILAFVLMVQGLAAVFLAILSK